MRTRTVLLGRRARRGRRGAVMVWFFLLAIPTMLFSLATSVDIGRLIVANRAVNLAAESAVVGASYQFASTQNGELDPVAAMQDARATMARAQAVGALKNATNIEVSVFATGTSVKMTVSYELERPLVLKYFLGRNNRVVNTTEAAAFVCVPGQPGPTDGNCSRPT